MPNQSPHTEVEFPAEYVEKWERFSALVQSAKAEVFGDDPRAHLIVGAQWGEMGKDEGGLLSCIVGSTLPVCQMGPALAEMGAYVYREHALHHGAPDPGFNYGEPEVVEEEVSYENLPDDIRAEVQSLMENLGLDPSQVRVYHSAMLGDIDADLAGLTGDDDAPEV